jgi:8-amino-3,8-dideoxy-alpha-D-manno-octulosonate transaminase
MQKEHQTMSLHDSKQDALAIEGGKPTKERPDPPMYPGGMLIGEEEEQAVLEVLRAKRLFRYYGPEPGPSKVEELEKAFAEHAGTRYALAVTSGTAALICGLQGIGVGPGDEVIVPAYTWIASPGSVVAVGAVPVVAEVDESLTLDPADVERKITPYTKAIMPVHMRGTPSRMDALMDVARRHGLKVIEDAAQADGASYKGRRLGSIGDVGCFSLQFNKILTSGEGGMVITNDEQVWKRALMFHDVVGPVAAPGRAAGSDARTQADAHRRDTGRGAAQGDPAPGRARPRGRCCCRYDLFRRGRRARGQDRQGAARREYRRGRHL